MAEETKCPECDARRPDLTKPCVECGATAIRPGDKRASTEEEVRGEDLEPYVTLRYIARMFKVLAILMVVMMIGEVITGIIAQGAGSVIVLITEVTRLLVLAALLWAGGDITVLLIDAGHDLRVARILLGRINSVLHREDPQKRDKAA